MRLAKLVEKRFLGIVAHACRAYFVNGQARLGDPGIAQDTLRAAGIEHLRSLVSHVFDHGTLVVPELRVDFENRNSPSVDAICIDFDMILEAGQALAEAGDTDAP